MNTWYNDATTNFKTFRTPSIQVTIEDYMGSSSGDVSGSTLRTFVGMLETGEATPDNFDAVGGNRLRDLVIEAKNDGRFN